MRFWQAKNGAYGNPPKLAQANTERLFYEQLFYERLFGEHVFLNFRFTRTV